MHKLKKPILGIIGGMGPSASNLFYEMVISNTEATCDQDHIDMIILNHATMPDRTESILSGEIDVIKEKLKSDIRFLDSAGISYLAVPCNTSHAILADIDMKGIVHINMIEEAAQRGKDISANGAVGIFATEGTIQTELYQRALNTLDITPVIPEKEVQKIITSVIYDDIKKGGEGDMKAFGKAVAHMSKRDCNTVILGCTELSVLRKQEDLSFLEKENNITFIDAMEVMARKAVILTGRKPLEKKEY